MNTPSPEMLLQMIDLVLRTNKTITITPLFKLGAKDGTSTISMQYRVCISDGGGESEANTLEEALVLACYMAHMSYEGNRMRCDPPMAVLGGLFKNFNPFAQR